MRASGAFYWLTEGPLRMTHNMRQRNTPLSERIHSVIFRRVSGHLGGSPIALREWPTVAPQPA